MKYSEMTAVERAQAKQKVNPGQWIERERLAPILERWLRDHEAEHNGVSRPQKLFYKRVINGSPQLRSAGAKQTLSFMTGVTQRQVWGILHGDAHLVSLGVVDRLLTGLGMVYLFYLPPEQGGFSDVYFHPQVMSAA